LISISIEMAVRPILARGRRGVGKNPLFWGIIGFFVAETIIGGTRTNRTYDSPTYLTLHFVGERLWTVPVAFTILGSDYSRVIGQTVFAAASWSTLIWVLAARISSRVLRILLALAVISVPLAFAVRQWNVEILSESIFTSLTVLLVAAIIVFLRRPTRWTLTAAAFVAFWLTFCRQAVVPVMFVVGVTFVVAAIWARNRRLVAALGLAIIAMAIPAEVIAIAGSSTIQRVNSATLIEGRVMTNPGELSYFVNHGMPVNKLVRAYAGDQSVPLAVAADPPVARWVSAHFSGTYIGYILSHPVSTFSTGLGQMPSLMTATPDYYATRTRRLPTDWAANHLWGWHRLVFYGLFVLAVVTGVSGIAIRDRRLDIERIVALCAAVAAVLYYGEVWLLSGTELARLTMPAAVLMRVSLISITICSLDLLWNHRRPLPAASSVSSTSNQGGRVPQVIGVVAEPISKLHGPQLVPDVASTSSPVVLASSLPGAI
jgi:hypothetical protein